ncbi:MAG TPA: PEP/pyruvate-binding domain-containing protein, partial [Chryseolinea sp.]
MSNLSEVGGKNASLGEMIKNLSPLDIQIPEGYAITVEAFDEFLKYNKIYDALEKALAGLDRLELTNLSSVAQDCRKLIDTGELPPKVKEAITKTHDRLVLRHGLNPSFAVRSSATAEDSPTTSFAGQHDSFLNVRGIEQVLRAVKQCYASLYNDRAIKYRNDNNFADMQVRLSVGVQIMVRSDRGSAGVAFTIEPENGNENLIYITGAWGLGESVVQGAVNTDEFYVFKPALKAGKNGIIYKQIGSKQSMLVYSDGSKDRNTAWRETTPSLRDQFVLTDAEVSKIALWCLEIEKHYGMPMDVEWAKDGITQQLYIVQARPETVRSQIKKVSVKEYSLSTDSVPVLSGKAVGTQIVSGKVRIVKSLADGNKVEHGDIIVADITNPDWNALLRRAVCIVTNKGGRTSHASIIARELGISAIVGTMNATEKLMDGQVITASCANGDIGLVYDGKLEWKEKETSLNVLSEINTKPMFILSD